MTYGQEVAQRESRHREDRRYNSDYLNKLVRQTGLGLAGIGLAFLLSDAVFAKLVVTEHKQWLLIISALGCSTVAADYFQFFSGYQGSSRAISNLYRHTPTIGMKIFQLLFRLFFVVKNITAIVGSSMLVALIFSVALKQ